MTQDNLMTAPEEVSLERKVIQWAKERGILDSAQPKDQLLKVVEELGEVAECIAKGKSIQETELELGDLQVTVILLSALVGTTAENSLRRAYAKISNRKGKMVNGVFIRDE